MCVFVFYSVIWSGISKSFCPLLPSWVLIFKVPSNSCESTSTYIYQVKSRIYLSIISKVLPVHPSVSSPFHPSKFKSNHVSNDIHWKISMSCCVGWFSRVCSSLPWGGHWRSWSFLFAFWRPSSLSVFWDSAIMVFMAAILNKTHT